MLIGWEVELFCFANSMHIILNKTTFYIILFFSFLQPFFVLNLIQFDFQRNELCFDRGLFVLTLYRKKMKEHSKRYK